jgi:hypothetical protein
MSCWVIRAVNNPQQGNFAANQREQTRIEESDDQVVL